jgi:hypothetical protein
MMKLLALAGLSATVAIGAQQPVVQNGRVDVRPGTSIEREIAAVGAGTEPVWVAWRVPMVPGDWNLCSTWSDGRTFVRGDVLEGRAPHQDPIQFPAPAGPLRLEAGTTLLVLGRVVDGRLERLRTVGDDCPIDAGGRTLYWLPSVTAGASVPYLEGLAGQQPLGVGVNRRLADAALSALSFHADPAATAVLERLSARPFDAAIRRQAATALSVTRGARGFDRVLAMLNAEPDSDLRRALVGALAQSGHEKTADALLNIARSDADVTVRGEAAYRYVRRGGEPALSTAVTLLDSDADESVKRRIISGIASLPDATSAPLLLQLARTHANPTVRREAVTALGRSKEPGAIGLMEEILGR